MIICRNIKDMLALRQSWDSNPTCRISLVPTMGCLHQAHVSLIDLAHQHSDRVVVSIFVNPLQFGPREDYDRYPRMVEKDLLTLQSSKSSMDALFLPEVKELWGEESSCYTTVDVPTLSQKLCGQSRPGHFAGVGTIITLLLHMIRPHTLIMGEKDYQQALIVQTLIRDLHLPTHLQIAPIMREIDGLAMSSRNRYLTTDQRQRAPQLYHSLCALRQRFSDNSSERTCYRLLEQEAYQDLQNSGWNPDYIAICDTRTLELADFKTPYACLRFLGAAHLGQTRLIDNISACDT